MMSSSPIRFLLNSLSARSIVSRRLASTLDARADEHKVVVAGNGSTIVCWHPQPSFPYECSKPLPQEQTDGQQSELRAPYTDALDARLRGVQPHKQTFVKRSDKQTREQLMRLTHTSKHVWFPKPDVSVSYVLRVQAKGEHVFRNRNLKRKERIRDREYM